MTTTNVPAGPRGPIDPNTGHTPAVGAIPRAVALHLLAGLYAQLPTVACRGLCHDACTIVGASQLERDVLAGRNITLSNKPPRLVIEQARANPDGKIGEQCPALSVFGRCTVYEVRPFICRAFGTVSHPAIYGPERFEQAMMCDHGCEPTGTINVEEFMMIMSEIEALSRIVTGIARQPIPGDSLVLREMFARDVVTERAGFTVGPVINRHISEPEPTPEPPAGGRKNKGRGKKRDRRRRTG